jgi:preprotein translocase subunit SecA
MNSQREIVYNRRNYSLHEDDISSELNQIVGEFIEDSISKHCQGMKENWDFDSYKYELLDIFGIDMKFNDEEDVSILKNETLNAVKAILKFKSENFDYDMFNNFQKYVILRTIDEKWQDHLYSMDQLREGIGLRAYGQKNPLIEYKQEGFAMFEDMMEETNKETLKRIFRTDLSKMAQSSMQATQNTKNLKTTTNDNVLNALSKPRPDNQSSNLGGIPQRPQAFSPGSKAQPVKADKKVGRNEECPCGSGKKYKKCHGAI